VDRQTLTLDELKKEINRQLSLDPDTQECTFIGSIVEVVKPDPGQPNWRVPPGLFLSGRPVGKDDDARRVIERVRERFNLQPE